MKTFMDNTFSKSIKEFTERHPEQRMRASLIQLFIDFVRYQDREGSMPTNTYTLLNDIEALFELISIVENHIKMQS
jgi:hypothetical protein